MTGKRARKKSFQLLEGKYIRAQNRKMREVLEALYDCPYEIEPLTVPMAGVDANPIQVVGTMHVSLLKYRKLQEVLGKLSPDKSVLTEKE